MPKTTVDKNSDAKAAESYVSDPAWLLENGNLNSIGKTGSV